MFETFEEEHRHGLKGLLARALGPVRHARLAEEGIHRNGLFFLSLAVVSGIVGWSAFLIHSRTE